MRKFEDQLDEALSKSPDYELPMDFSDRVTRKIEMKQLASDRRIQLVTLFSSVGFVLLAVICLAIFASGDILNQLAEFGGWALLIGVMVVFIQILDNKLVKRKIVTL